MRLEKLFKVFHSFQLMRVLFFHRVLIGAEHRSVLDENLRTVIDIGANKGQFTLAVRYWARKARVIAFEPLTAAADRFRKVFQGDKKVILHQAAIGPETGEAKIHVAAAEDSSSLLPITNIQELLFPGTGEIQRKKVKLGKLSDFVSPEEIEAPAMLKLDIQGYELEALRGCEELLTSFSYIYAECSFVELYYGQALVDDIIAWLRERDWCLCGIYNMIYDHKGQSVQADFLFENSHCAEFSCLTSTV